MIMQIQYCFEWKNSHHQNLNFPIFKIPFKSESKAVLFVWQNFILRIWFLLNLEPHSFDGPQ